MRLITFRAIVDKGEWGTVTDVDLLTAEWRRYSVLFDCHEKRELKCSYRDLEVLDP